MNEIALPFDDFQSMFISHIRYCLDRHSYMVCVGGEHLKKYWQCLDKHTKYTIKLDIETRLEREKTSPVLYQDDIDYWQRIFDWIEEQEPTE